MLNYVVSILLKWSRRAWALNALAFFIFVFSLQESSAYLPRLAFWHNQNTVAALTLLAGNIGGPGAADGTGAEASFLGPQGVTKDSTGNLFVTDSDAHTIRKITSAGVVTTFAGAATSSGGVDGTGSNARFNLPYGIVADSSDNLYVSDTLNKVIRKVTPAGVVTTFAGALPGSDGTGAAASFQNPYGSAADSSGNVYVADSSNHIIRKITSAGVVTTLAGTAGVIGSADGTGSAASFYAPLALTVDSSGNVFVADSSNSTIRKITAAGVVTTFAGLAGSTGSTNGTGTAARFNVPNGIAVDSTGNLYVSDSNNNTIRKVTSAGVVTDFAGAPAGTDGTGYAARFYAPKSAAVDSSGNVYVADQGSHTIRKVTSAGVVTTFVGSPGVSGFADGTGSAATFTGPLGLAVDSADNIYATDNNAIRKITPAGVVSTLAGSSIVGSSDGTGSAAQFYFPSFLTVDSSGNIFATDTYNHTIRKITSAGVVTTIAGTAGSAGSTDGTGAAALFNLPVGITVDGSGNLFVTDTNNHTIRKITSAGVVTTLAGIAGNMGYADGTGTAAKFSIPKGLTIDGSGNLFVMDFGNYSIRKVTGAGVVTTLAGASGYPGYTDGTGSAARINQVAGISIDGSGNLFFVDEYYETLRKSTSAGVVTTIAGANPAGDGTGANASFYRPTGVAVDSSGNVYVSDGGNQTIRKITSAGVATTLAGTPRSAGSSDGTGSVARFNGPSGLILDSSNNVYVTDSTNQTIRKVTSGGVVTTIAGTQGTAGYVNGTGTAVKFNFPRGITIDSSNNLYIADSTNGMIRKSTLTGTVSDFAGASSGADGTGAAARFGNPLGIAIDSSGNLFIADSTNQTIRKVTSAGVVTTLAGSVGAVGTADGTGSVARFNNPIGVAVSGSGDLCVTDNQNNTIRLVTSAGVVTTLAGDSATPGSADGTGVAASFSSPTGITIASSGDFYVVDGGNSTIRKVTAAGVVTTVAGSAGTAGSVDGTGAAASFYSPNGIVEDSSGNLFVADTYNTKIRKITAAAVVSTFAGSVAVVGIDDGIGSAATFMSPMGLATDSSGNLYVADAAASTIRKITSAGVVSTLAGSALAPGSADGTGAAASFTYVLGVTANSASDVFAADYFAPNIRQITSAGVVTTLAGTAGVSGTADGSGLAAQFLGPSATALDSSGNIFVADFDAHTIRKITSAGVVTTFAGSASTLGSTDGTGGTARFNNPISLAIDSSDNIYVSDSASHTIRKITSAGVVTTIAGSPGVFGSADGTGSAARFHTPGPITVGSTGNIYVADQSNHTIRKITAAGVVTTVVGTPSTVSQGVKLGPLPGTLNFTNNSGLASGNGKLYISTNSGIITCPEP